MPYLKPERPEKVSAPSLKASKERGERLVCLTAYDYPTARIVDEAGIDIILVGDSLGNVVLGYGNTVPVTLDQIWVDVKAVRRGVERASPGPCCHNPARRCPNCRRYAVRIVSHRRRRHGTCGTAFGKRRRSRSCEVGRRIEASQVGQAFSERRNLSDGPYRIDAAVDQSAWRVSRAG